ncbi:MAG: RNA 2'-phosphotransferase [Bacteroidota bacterium]
MNNKKLSKTLSYLLRHRPDKIGLQLDQEGWADIDALLLLLSKNGQEASFTQLQQVVTENDKQRFTLNVEQRKIRANQGHSIDIDLGLDKKVPPAILYHGTAQRFVPSIKRTGLDKRNRHHVHLSDNKATAQNVGSRHGKVVVLEIDTQCVIAAGYDFYQSDNGVWLVDAVPLEGISFPN